MCIRDSETRFTSSGVELTTKRNSIRHGYLRKSSDHLPLNMNKTNEHNTEIMSDSDSTNYNLKSSYEPCIQCTHVNTCCGGIKKTIVENKSQRNQNFQLTNKTIIENKSHEKQDLQVSSSLKATTQLEKKSKTFDMVYKSDKDFDELSIDQLQNGSRNTLPDLEASESADYKSVLSNSCINYISPNVISFSNHQKLFCDLRVTLLWACVLLATVAMTSSASVPLLPVGATSTREIKIVFNTREFAADKQGVDDYLEKFGYYPNQQGGSGLESTRPSTVFNDLSLSQSELKPRHTNSERVQALLRLQKFFHLRPTGEVDTRTKHLLDASRCGFKDITSSEDRSANRVEVSHRGDKQDRMTTGVEAGDRTKREASRRKRYAVSRYADGTVSRWLVNRLTWELTTPTNQMSVDLQRRAIRESFDIWNRVMPIDFVEHRGPGEADIRLAFLSGEHGPPHDPVFDGRETSQNTLAHAWGPSFNAKGLPGDVHFDADDPWTSFEEMKAVTVHELGHSMGLLHSDDQNAVMFPIYRNVTAPSEDDLAGINYLYGPNSGWNEARATTTTTQSPRGGGRTRKPTRRKYYTVKPQWVTSPPPLSAGTCLGVRVDAVFKDPSSKLDGVYMAISGDRVHTLSSRGNVIQSEPLQSAYPDAPERPEVVFSVVNENNVYFIKDEKIWAYQNRALLAGYPRSVGPLGFPEKPKFSITMQDASGITRPLLFGKQYWWTFDARGRASQRYDTLSRFSRDLPQDVMFAAQWADNQLYAVTRNSYVVLDMERREAVNKQPIAGKPDWLKELCENGSRPISQSSLLLFTVLAVYAGLHRWDVTVFDV